VERVNGVSNQYLKNLVGVDQQDWMEYMGPAEFSCNVAMHLATKRSSLVMTYGVDVLQPNNLALEGLRSTLEFNHDGKDLAKKCIQVLKITKLLVEKA
jgi:hypothetical protein